jgi:hypothetical protein
MRHSSTIAFSRRSTHPAKPAAQTAGGECQKARKNKGKIKEKRLLMMDVMADAKEQTPIL